MLDYSVFGARPFFKPFEKDKGGDQKKAPYPTKNSMKSGTTIRKENRTMKVKKNLLLMMIGIGLMLCAMNGSTFTDIEKVGNPARNQFPENNSLDCYARSVWDMRQYQRKIYIGSGDLNANRGPIYVWSMDGAHNFLNEYTVAEEEEEIHLFREYDGKLFIPGFDSRESWAYGNLYINDQGWQKLRTIPRGIHVTDVALFQEKLYVVIQSLYYSEVLESYDGGQTWKSLNKIYWSKEGRFLRLMPLDDFLLITGIKYYREPFVFKYVNGDMEKLSLPLPSLRSPFYSDRLTRFKEGVLYIGDCILTKLSKPSPLLFCDDFEKGPIIVGEFQDKFVRDILVVDERCYVLTASQEGDVFQGHIYTSSDLKTWVKLAEFPVPALPYSFELLEGTFYVGLGNRRVQNGYADIESGSIYQLDLASAVFPRMTFTPDQWNLSWQKSRGSVKCFIGNYPGYEIINVSDIDIFSIRLNDNVLCKSGKIVAHKKGFAGPVICLEFEKAELINSLSTVFRGDILEVKVTGKLRSGTRFKATSLVKMNGKLSPSLPDDTLMSLPNFPNPSNPETWIPFQLAEDRDAKIKIYSASGQLIRILDLGYKSAGSYTTKDRAAHWDGKNQYGEPVSSGVYFYHFQAGDFRIVNKMLLIK